MNGTQWGQATMGKNILKGCISNNMCLNVVCPDPFECNNIWMGYECR